MIFPANEFLCPTLGQRRVRGIVKPRDATLGAAMAVLVVVLGASPILASDPRDVLDLGTEPDVHGMALSPDGNTLAVQNKGAVAVWDAKTQKQTAVFKPKGWAPTGRLEFTGDGRGLVIEDFSVGFDEKGRQVRRWSVHLWDIAEQKERGTFSLPDVSSCGWVVTPDGKSVLIGTRSFGIWVYDLETGKQINDFQYDEKPTISEARSLAVSSDGKMLAVGTKAGNVFVFDLAKGKLLHEIPNVGPGDSQYQIDLLAFSPDGTRLAAANFMRAWLEILDPAAGKSLDTCQMYASGLHRLYAFAYSPDGKTIAMVGDGTLAGEKASQTVELWDLDKFGFRADFSGKRAMDGMMRCVLFTPDGKSLITGGRNIPVEFWDVPAGAPKSVRQDTTPPIQPPFFLKGPGKPPGP